MYVYVYIYIYINIYVIFFFFKEMLDGQRSGDQLKRSRRKGRNRQEVPAFAEPDTTKEVKTPFDLAKVSACRMNLFLALWKR